MRRSLYHGEYIQRKAQNGAEELTGNWIGFRRGAGLFGFGRLLRSRKHKSQEINRLVIHTKLLELPANDAAVASRESKTLLISLTFSCHPRTLGEYASGSSELICDDLSVISLIPFRTWKNCQQAHEVFIRADIATSKEPSIEDLSIVPATPPLNLEYC